MNLGSECTIQYLNKNNERERMLTGYLERLNKLKIVLGSKSEPRKQLLQNAGLIFATEDSGFEEDLDKTKFSSPLEYVKATVKGKLDCLMGKPDLKFDILIACDSVIVFSGKILEKPESHEEHKKYMRMLSNNSHECITCMSVVLRRGTQLEQEHFHTITEILFGEIPEESIDCMSTVFPALLNAAGGYQIQASSGSIVKEIRGSSTGLIGIPMYELATCLIKYMSNDTL